MNIKNLNLLLASSTALLGLIIGFQGNTLIKTLGASALASTVGFTASQLISRGKRHDRLYDAEKLVSVLKTDKIRFSTEAKTLQILSDDFYQTIQTLNSEAIAMTEERELLTKRLQTAVGQVATVQDGYLVIKATLEAQKAEKLALVAELDETLEDLRFATEDIEGIIEDRLTVETSKIHKAYKEKLMVNVEKLSEGKFAAKAKNLLTGLEELKAENERLTLENERYQTEFDNVQDAMKEPDEFDFDDYMGGQVEQYKTRIDELNVQIALKDNLIASLEVPQRLPEHRDNEPGNYVIDYVWRNRKIAMDGIYRTVSEGTNETFWFQLRNLKQLNDVRMTVNTALEDIRVATGLKGISPIEWDSEKSLMKFSCTNHVKILDKAAIERLWVPSSRFPSLVKEWNRIRITGASEGSKSPLARNILGAKLMNGEKFDLVRFDPSGGSPKDFWRVEADSTDFAELPGILKQMKEDTFSEARKTNPNRLPRIYVLDETDSSLNRVKDPEAMAIAIKEAGKHGSHTGVGIILAGQNANVTNYKGFQRSDFNSFVNIHIGANINDALANSNDASKVTELVTNARILIDYCDSQNKEIENIADRYQVAMVEEKGKRYFIQLPRLGEYGFDKSIPGNQYDFPSGFSTLDYDDSLRGLNQALVSGKSLRTQAIHKTAETPIVTLATNPQNEAETPIVTLPLSPHSPHHHRCPHCESDRLVGNGANRYKCKSCNKSFAKSKALGV